MSAVQRIGITVAANIESARVNRKDTVQTSLKIGDRSPLRASLQPQTQSGPAGAQTPTGP